MAKKGLTKAQVIGHFAEKLDVKRAVARSFFEELTTLAAKEVKKSGQFVIPGVGKLVLSKRKARLGRNPQTGEQIQIPAKTVLKFRIAKQMKDSVIPKK
jgi:DNA-binding protein HU-beta